MDRSRLKATKELAIAARDADDPEAQREVARLRELVKLSEEFLRSVDGFGSDVTSASR